MGKCFISYDNFLDIAAELNSLIEYGFINFYSFVIHHSTPEKKYHVHIYMDYDREESVFRSLSRIFDKCSYEQFKERFPEAKKVCRSHE